MILSIAATLLVVTAIFFYWVSDEGAMDADDASLQDSTESLGLSATGSGDRIRSSIQEDDQASIEYQNFIHDVNEHNDSGATDAMTGDMGGSDEVTRVLGTLDGCVVDGKGAPVSDAKVRAVRIKKAGKAIAIDDYDIIETESKDEGRFVIEGLPEGSYALRAMKGKFACHSTIDVKSTGKVKGETRLALIPAGTITGWVRNPEGTPLKGIIVIPMSLRAAVAESNGTGRFDLEGLPTGKYKIVTFSDRHHTRSQTDVETDGKSVEFFLPSINEENKRFVPQDAQVSNTGTEGNDSKNRASSSGMRHKRRNIERGRELHDPRMRDRTEPPVEGFNRLDDDPRLRRPVPDRDGEDGD